jgi:hypothetical protein
MPWQWIPDGFTITDVEFASSKNSQETVYRDEGKRQNLGSYLNALGHARWDTDYLTLRQAGYSHDAACQEVRCRIREAWSPPLPAVEPHPQVPVPPVPPQPPPPLPPTNQPGVKDDAERFCRHYLAQCQATGFKPDANSTHEQQMQFLRQCVLSFHDPTIVMKRASTTRPISNEVIVFARPQEQYRWYWDIIGNAGTPDWIVQAAGPGAMLPLDQPLVDPKTLEILPGW